jgi:hypothetical protein
MPPIHAFFFVNPLAQLVTLTFLRIHIPIVILQFSEPGFAMLSFNHYDLLYCQNKCPTLSSLSCIQC